MKVMLDKKEKPFHFLIAVVVIMVVIKQINLRLTRNEDSQMVMGGEFQVQSNELRANELKANEQDSIVTNYDNENNAEYNSDQSKVWEQEDVETYYRPSKLPVLNNRPFNLNFYRDENGFKGAEMDLPDYIFQTPEDTLLNYFSILRDAAHWIEGKYAGCGTIGLSNLPYPVAYQFLSTYYQNKLSYEEYLKTFENILHTNLIKIKQVPVYQAPSNLSRYFVELETIQGSDQDSLAYFAYYYGFVDVVKEGALYKISDLKFYGENYLCAPMHGWSYNAEAVVQVMYGGWCSMIETLYPTIQDGYVKQIPFKGTDGFEYMIEFYQLTNDTDIEIAQYRKGKDGSWELIKLDPHECLEKKKKE